MASDQWFNMVLRAVRGDCLAKQSRRHATHDRIRCDIFCYDRTGGDDGATPYRDSLSHNCTGTDPHLILNHDWLCPCASADARNINQTVIHSFEHHAGPDLYILSDRHFVVRHAETALGVNEGPCPDLYILGTTYGSNGDGCPDRALSADTHPSPSQ